LLLCVLFVCVVCRWVRNFEGGLLEAYDRFRRGEGPSDISVEDRGGGPTEPVEATPLSPCAPTAMPAAALAPTAPAAGLEAEEGHALPLADGSLGDQGEVRGTKQDAARQGRETPREVAAS
jgi:hypothetical protein